MKNNYQNRNELIITTLLNKCISFSDSNDNGEDLIGLLVTISSSEKVCRAYPEISQVIYHLDQDEFAKISDFFGVTKTYHESSYIFEILRGQQKELISLNKSQIDNINRLERHIRLSCYQRLYINDMTKNAQAMATDAENIAQGAKKKVTSIYSEFVGILAIFTAMSFAMMGSVQALGNLFSNLTNAHKSTIGYALIIGGIYLAIMYFLIMTLVLAMQKLFNTDKGNYGFNRKFVTFYFSFAIIMIAVGLLVVLFFG